MARFLCVPVTGIAALLLVLCVLASVPGYPGAAPSSVSAHEDKQRAGAELFATSGCTHCHAVDGTGTDRGPSLRDVRKRRKPDQIAEQIKHGGQAMPAFGDSLNDAQIAELVAFLDAKKWKLAPAPASPATKAVQSPSAPTP